MAHKPSIVLELQALAADEPVPLETLLRKALLVATKLKLDDFREWIDHELKGYKNLDVPEYRKCYATINAKNPYHGWIPVEFGDAFVQRAFCEVELREPVSNLSSLVAQTAGSGFVTQPLTAQENKLLMEAIPLLRHMPVVRAISSSQVAAVLDTVRSTILEWALELENQGILGEGMSFSKEDRERAAQTPSIHIGSFQGILGNVEGSVVKQELSINIRPGSFADLRAYLESLGIPAEDIEELQEAIQSEPEPRDKATFGERVSEWIGKMVSKAARGAWQLGVPVASNLLTKALLLYYGIA